MPRYVTYWMSFFVAHMWFSLPHDVSRQCIVADYFLIQALEGWCVTKGNIVESLVGFAERRFDITTSLVNTFIALWLSDGH